MRAENAERRGSFENLLKLNRDIVFLFRVFCAFRGKILSNPNLRYLFLQNKLSEKIDHRIDAERDRTAPQTVLVVKTLWKPRFGSDNMPCISSDQTRNTDNSFAVRFTCRDGRKKGILDARTGIAFLAAVKPAVEL